MGWIAKIKEWFGGSDTNPNPQPIPRELNSVELMLLKFAENAETAYESGGQVIVSGSNLIHNKDILSIMKMYNFETDTFEVSFNGQVLSHSEELYLKVAKCFARIRGMREKRAREKVIKRLKSVTGGK